MRGPPAEYGDILWKARNRRLWQSWLSSYPRFRSSDQLDSSLGAQLPITLIQGGAEKVSFTFQFSLDDETIGELKDGGDFAEAMKKCRISIRFYSAKNRLYSTMILMKDAILSDA